MPPIVFTLCTVNVFRIYTSVHVPLSFKGLEVEEGGENVARTYLRNQQLHQFFIVGRRVLESSAVEPKTI